MDASGPGSFGLPRERRIKQGRDFARAKSEGRRIVQGCLILNWVNLPSGSASRVGVITSRRVGESVIRSRARRLLREAFRLNQPSLAQPADVVLVARPSIAGKSFNQVAGDYQAALKKARLWKGEAS
jgi:ribonuclease P protein component